MSKSGSCGSPSQGALGKSSCIVYSLPERARSEAMTVADQQPTPSSVDDVRLAKFHHVNFFTVRLEEMREWYILVLGMDVTFEFPMGCWLTNDEANHRIAFTQVPGLVDDPDKRIHT